MESEGPYRKITHYTKFETGDSRIDAYGDGVAELDVTNSDGWGILRLINSAHFEGRKAERERLYKEIMGYSKEEISYSESDTPWKSGHGKAVDGVIEKLRGGQDGK